MDLTSIDLDLEPQGDAPAGTEQASTPATAPVAASEPETLVPPSASAPEGGADSEVETKLELARAYDEMGDKEGALELLNEVLAEGGPAQQAAARTLIEKLG
jgi:pilus assembly protein FimV